MSLFMRCRGSSFGKYPIYDRMSSAAYSRHGRPFPWRSTSLNTVPVCITHLWQMVTELIRCIILLSQLLESDDRDNAASISHLIFTFEEGEHQRNP